MCSNSAGHINDTSHNRRPVVISIFLIKIEVLAIYLLQRETFPTKVLIVTNKLVSNLSNMENKELPVIIKDYKNTDIYPDEIKHSTMPINLSWRRWPIMISVVMYAMTSTFQNVQFVIMPDIFTTYYDVSVTAITWTSMIIMAVYIVLTIPAMVLIDNIGLRTVLLIGAGLNAAGTLIKCAAINAELFWIGRVTSNADNFMF